MSSALVLSAAAAAVTAGQVLTTFDGSKSTTQHWFSENDPVMGGVSNSTFTVEGGFGHWSGEVKIVPKLRAPGFCTARTTGDQFPDISSADGLIITADADTTGLTNFKISMESAIRGNQKQGEFEGKFTATSESLTQYFVPFSSMTQSWRGEPEGGPPSKKQLAAITSLGFNLDGVAGKFSINIRSIAAGSKPGPGPGPGPGPSKTKTLIEVDGGGAEGGKFSVVNDPVMGGASVSNISFNGPPHNQAVWAGEVKIVRKLNAPGFCRLDADFSKVDISGFDGLYYEFGSSDPANPVTQKLMAILSGKTLFHEFQFTAPVAAPAMFGAAFVPFASFKPFGIRPMPGAAPTTLELEHITEVGLLADGTKGAFQVFIKRIAASTTPAPVPSGAGCHPTQYCCPDAKACLAPVSETSCDPSGAADEECESGEICCPLTKMCVVPGPPCTPPPICGAGAYCCPDAKACLTPVEATGVKFCDPSDKASCSHIQGGVCCPLIKQCVTVGSKCDPTSVSAFMLH